MAKEREKIILGLNYKTDSGSEQKMTGNQTPEWIHGAFNSPLIKEQRTAVSDGQSLEIMQRVTSFREILARFLTSQPEGEFLKFYLCSSPERIDVFQRAQDRG